MVLSVLPAHKRSVMRRVLRKACRERDIGRTGRSPGTITGENGSSRSKWMRPPCFRIYSPVPKQQRDLTAGMGSGRASHACTTRYFPGGWIGPAATEQRSISSGLAFRYRSSAANVFPPVDTKYLISSGTGMYPTWKSPPDSSLRWCQH